MALLGFVLRHLRAACLWAVPPGTGSPVDATRHDEPPRHESPGTLVIPPATARATKPAEADPEALHRLVVDHGDAVFRLAYSILRDRALAEDVAQDTMLKAWLALPSFRGDSSLRGWIMRIAHNTAISTLRSRRALVTDPADLPEVVESNDRGPDTRTQNAVVMAEFESALGLLDDLSRSVVVLREIEGLSYEEIAQLLNVPLPTVKTRLLRSRRKLASALREWS